MNEYCYELYYAHSSTTYPIAYKMLRDHYEAEDVVIEVFFKLYICLQSDPDIKNIPGWLKTVATTTSLDVVRKRKFIPQEVVRHEVSMDDFVDTLIHKSLSNDLLRTLYKKNPKWFRYMGMKYLLEMSFEEIAKAEGVSVNSVKSSIARAKKYLAKKHFPAGLDVLLPIILTLIEIFIEKNT